MYTKFVNWLIDTFENFSTTHASSKTSLFEFSCVSSSPFLILIFLLISFVRSISPSSGHLFVNLLEESSFSKLSTGFLLSSIPLKYSYG